MRGKRIYFLLLSMLVGYFSYGQAPTAIFSSDAVAGCSPFKVNFVDLSTGNPTAWEWDLGNGTISTKKDPSGFYIQPGIYQVKLKVSNASGSNSVTKSITVYESPKPAISADKTSGCSPLTVKFSDQSNPGNGSTNTTWLWDLGNGSQSNEQNPTIRYTAPGSYTVVLKVTNDKGCSSIITRNKMIEVSPGLDISFSNTPASVCQAPFQIQFQNATTGTGTLQYLWKFGDGATSTLKEPLHTYTRTGKYKVTLIVTNGSSCTDSLVKEIDLSAIQTDFSISNTLCVNSPIALINTSSPAPSSSLWKFPDGSSSNQKDGVKTFSAAGNYTIKLINNYGSCVDSIEKTIIVTNSPVALFKPSILSKCNPDLTVNFENLSTNANRFEWDFGDGSSVLKTTSLATSHTYTKEGQFFVTLTAYNNSGCSSTYTFNKPITIAPPAVKIEGLPEQGCVPLSITPVASIASLSNIVEYEWNFDDGTIIKSLAPTHIFTRAGNYTVRLTITTADGCKSTTTHKIAVGDKPKLAFTAAPRNVCAIDSVYFTNTSQPADAKYTWYFGDGTTSNLYNVAYPYNDTGWFRVKLVVDNNGCVDTLLSDEKYIFIKPPIARFSLEPDCAVSYKYQLVDRSLFDKGSEGRRTWKWEFPDGTVSNNQVPPIYTFPRPGVYTVTLTVSNGTCFHVTKQQIKIEDKTPDFSFDKNSNCKPVAYTFRAITPTTQQVVSYKWEVNGFDTITTKPVFLYLFKQAGNFNIKLTTTDIFGCVNSVTKPVLISGPKATFERINKEACKKMTASFSDISQSFGINPIVSWKWDFGDGTQIEKKDNQPFDHLYSKAGMYKVTLYIKDAAGCTDSVVGSDLVQIIEMQPKWSSMEQACLGFPITYENQSTGDFKSFAWDFGDGAGNSTTNTGTYTYKDTGYYDVKLTIQDALGCKDSLVRKKHIHIAKPIAAFTVKDSISYCPPFDVNFTNASSFYNKVTWKIVDERSTEINHRKLFTIPGEYKVELNVVSPDGKCKASTFKTITLYKPEDATLEYDPLRACLPGVVNLKAFDKMASARFFWDFGDGNILDSSANEARHVYTDLGSFTPKIILTESTGCILTIAGKYPILIKGVKTKFNVSSQLFCDSGTVKILDSTTSNDRIVKHFWDFGDGTTSTLKKPDHKYARPGLYSIFYSAETEAGCIDSMRLNAPIKVVPTPVIGIRGDSIICVNEHLRHSGVLENRDTSAIRWAWQFPNGSQSAAQNPSIQQYNTPGKFQIKTIAINSSGCADTAIQNIIVHPNPVVHLPAVINTQVGVPVILPGKYSSNVQTYNWKLEKTLSCTDCPQPLASPRFDTKYTVSVVDSNGCKSNGEVMVNVLCQGITVFLPNTFSPNGDGANDVFYVRGQGLDRVKSLRIFNRWGEVVFEQKDFPANSAQHGWDGKFKGNKPKPDVYIYQLELFCGNGDLMVFPGNVALIQ